MLYTYNLELTMLNLGGVLVTEFYDGEALNVELSDDDFETMVGSHGAVVRSAKYNNVADFTINVIQGSPTNALLFSLLQADRTSTSAPFSFGYVDPANNDTVTGPAAWFNKPPPMSQQVAAQARVWAGKIANPVLTFGGGAPVVGV